MAEVQDFTDEFAVEDATARESLALTSACSGFNPQHLGDYFVLSGSSERCCMPPAVDQDVVATLQPTLRPSLRARPTHTAWRSVRSR